MSVSRRRLLRIGAAGSAAVLVGTSAVSSGRLRAPRWIGGDPFALGVASGDPTPDGVVLWTRLAPDPLAPDGHGGMAFDPVTVDYEVAHDEGFRQVVARGSAVATRELAHSVHPEVRGLEPDRWYYYRFRAGSALSPVGRTRTAPPFGQDTARLRFAFASCQSWSSGYFTAYDHMSREDLDLVIHLGDYIYERGWINNRAGVPASADFQTEAVDLSDYRLRYAQVKTEAPLRAAHAAFPWLTTMDDHEVDNNWAGERPGLGFDIHRLPFLFRRRKAAAFQAMYEHQPLRIEQLPSGPNILLHRRFRFGDLADITMLDTRSYRTPQACGDGDVVVECAERATADRTILGARQRDWLLDGLSGSPARWQVLGNQVSMSRTDTDPGPAVAMGTDAWDGYLADRAAVLGAAAARGAGNLVVITGDRHQHCASDLRRDHGDPESPVVASEFIGTSISSGGNGTDLSPAVRRLMAANPDLKFSNSQRGYVRVDLNHDLWRTDFRVLPYVHRPDAPIHTRATYVVQNGLPGVVEAWRPDAPDPAQPDTDAGPDTDAAGPR
ncbi:alkaline phosphatase D family protein [Nocardia otitidiscaviarum]|uniref:alkaline phosphatase D family protein n=1 Tax=Nocardia otitidiscaviarum TaxID=1823 RepID=UPI0004A7018F|nr:alkaline phosphatase D family protein [Nocardia otitidiscaviarum]MBF6135417.1 alkaline phosphatase D family protein [Nocardia otitidiscaviarum]MBF6487239.1 alkaline phosphatase D family protein [Nocardia otitidiscaviarum]